MGRRSPPVFIGVCRGCETLVVPTGFDSAGTPMARVVLENFTKKYPEKSGGEVTAVRGINLVVEDGEFMVLVGPSGCGKSTTLRMIAGLEEISDGTIAIDGRVVNAVPPKDRDIAMVFQNYALYPHMSVYENLAFGLKMRGRPREEIEVRVREAAALLGLEELLPRRPKALSGGQRQRVAVGRAIVRQPKVFLFDEPLSNLDAKMRGATRTELAKLHARLKATMIYVTHDQVEAMTMGDRICVMKDGAIMQVAKPLTLYHEPANLFVAGFIGSPPMNFFPGQLEIGSSSGPRFVAADDAWILTLPSRLAEAAGATRAVTLGVRPEDVAVNAAPAVAPSIPARIELVEPMGAETYLHLAAGPTMLVARTVPCEDHRVGGEVALTFSPERAHLFDSESGAAFRPART
jgi:multiple sugar transport system ATP-binding protein